MKMIKLSHNYGWVACHFVLCSAMVLTGLASSGVQAADPSAPVYFTIKSRWSGDYLVDTGNDLQYRSANPSSDTAYHWSFTSRGGGYYDIRNRRTGDLINIERLQEPVQSDKSCPATGDSCKWAIEKTNDGFFRLRNGWRPTDYLHIQDLKGFVQHGRMYPVWASAQWQIAPATTTAEAERDNSSTFFLIKNRWNGNYVMDGGEDLLYSATTPLADPAYHWSFIFRGSGYYDIKNRKTGELINIERLKDSVQSDKGCPPIVGDSCKWAIEKTSDGYFRLRNGWQMNNYLHVQDRKGYVQHGLMYPVWESAQWQISRIRIPATPTTAAHSPSPSSINLAVASPAVVPNVPNVSQNTPVITQQPVNISQPDTSNVNQPEVPPSTSSNNLPNSAQPSESINAQNFGAVGDGRTDNQLALQTAINAAKAQGKMLWLPAGTYNHSGVLTLDGAHMKGSGSGTVLHATNPDQSAIQLTGNNSSISYLKTTVLAPNRSSMYDPAAILVRNASNASVSYVIAQGASSNGIRVDNATGCQIHNNLVLGTNADGIALMNGSSGNRVRNNVVYQAGDDSFSDNSYRGEARQNSNNTFEGNMSLRNAYGRGFVMAGSRNSTVKNNIIVSSLWVGVAADTDPNSSTMESSGHTIINNLFIDNTRGEPVRANGPGMTVSGNQTGGSVPALSSILGWDPGALPDRYSFNAIYRPGTGPGSNNSGGNRS